MFIYTLLIGFVLIVIGVILGYIGFKVADTGGTLTWTDTAIGLIVGGVLIFLIGLGLFLFSVYVV